jgi:hypothetical protein
MLAEAQAVSAELQKTTVEAKASERSSTDLFQKGSVWKGSRKFPIGGPPVPLELRVTSREGEQFQGRIETQYGNAWDLEGTIRGDKVEWKVTKVVAGKGNGESHTGVLAGNVLTVEFVASKAAADGNRTGTGRLVLNTYGEAVSRDDAQPIAPVESAQSQKMSNVADFDQFLALYERAWKEEQNRLVNAIENRKTLIRKSKLDGDERRRRLDVIEKDLQALNESQTLPSSDDLLDAVVDLIERYHKVVRNLESTREFWSNRAVRLNDKDAIAKLDALEQRLDKIIGGREKFETDSRWSGKRQTETTALQMILTVTNRTGTSFVGRLRQTMGGPGDIMQVEGKLDRNKITFQTAQMLRGKNRKLSFTGYLLSGRIITSVGGINLQGKPANGWMTLWREGEQPKSEGRRRKESSR